MKQVAFGQARLVEFTTTAAALSVAVQPDGRLWKKHLLAGLLHLRFACLRFRLRLELCQTCCADLVVA